MLHQGHKSNRGMFDIHLHEVKVKLLEYGFEATANRYIKGVVNIN